MPVKNTDVRGMDTTQLGFVMMNKISAFGMAALMAATVIIPATTQDAEAGRRGRALAAGAVLGLAGAAIIANSNRAYAGDRYYERRGYRSQCRRWAYRCDRGNDYACDKYEYHC